MKSRSSCQTREYKAVLKGGRKLDLALLKIDAKGSLPAAPLGDSDTLEVGEPVMAIGNRFGLGQTVTAGIVSAKGGYRRRAVRRFIQTRRLHQPRQFGWPLFNSKGEVIGINTAIVAGGQGIGFAIPINMAKEILPQLKEKAK
jgi:serine protease Do